MNYQSVVVLFLLVFYMAYVIKLSRQRKNGIQTSQLGKGNIENGIKDKRTLLVEKCVSAVSYLVVLFEVFSILMDTHRLQQSSIRIAGLVLVGLGCLSFVTGMITMKDNWRAGIPDTDKTELVQKGIFKISRNPAFLGFDLTYLGVLLAFFNIPLCIITIAALLAFHFQILEEEKFLAKTFGDSYVEYKKKVGRYFLVF